MQEQYNSLKQKGIWELILQQRGKGAEALGIRWHVGVKYSLTGRITRFKARFMAKVNSEIFRKGLF